MFERRSLKWPITVGVVLIVLVVALTIGWVLLSFFGGQWLLAAIGAAVFCVVLLGVVFYLVLTIKEVNLNRRQSNFMDSITHELKSPIASLKLYLQTLTMRQVEENEREEFHRYMLEDVERLDALINHLLIAAHINKGGPLETPDEMELSSMLQQCAASVCMRYRTPPETVSLDLVPCLVRARQVDADLIFRNLIDNGIKYGGSPPRVEIVMRPREGGKVCVTVSDNGRGIPAHLRNKIFGRFVRLGFELQREKPGTGLGLHIVWSLVRRLKGKIRVKDAEDGIGAQFEVLLPGRAMETETAEVPGETEAS
ncbi:sensor histidine kinase [Lignipirellula cremea]|uniref:histidine kinase n=1 Tax=Lignipirellula cremea TaxID=2528010 RepID=A0A518DYF4_9BACT|nr:HAMP domain-containing sensor histidine kinase [Lignipirellula cremea]QDU96883.1 Alkaline phosphatase synthesis sensor protein PhoR [Lignipirellula cremea]